MPHLTLEYSSNLGTAITPALLRTANQALLGTGQFQEIDIKSRAIAFDCFAVGINESPRGFVAARLELLSGRDGDTKRDMAARLLAALKAAIVAAELELQISVQIVDIDRDSYAKTLIPPKS